MNEEKNPRDEKEPKDEVVMYSDEECEITRSSMDELAASLRADQEQDRKANRQEGRAAGLSYAKDAPFRELQGVAKYIALADRENSPWWDEDAYDWANLGAAINFTFAAWPEHKDDATAPRKFWEHALGDDNARRVEDPDFLRGFGDGVVEVWDQVIKKL
jgi:hypothetical protein